MGAFIVAGLIAAAAFAIAFVEGALFSTETGLGGPNPWRPLIAGLALAGIVASSHWRHQIGW